MYSFVLTSRKNYVAGDVRINIEQNSRMELMGDGSLQLKNAQRSDQGDYTCVVFNEHSKDFITYILVVQGQSACSQEMFIFVYSLTIKPTLHETYLINDCQSQVIRSTLKPCKFIQHLIFWYISIGFYQPKYW